MPADPALVLLPGLHGPTSWEAVEARVPGFHVLTPALDTTGSPSRPFRLEDVAASVVRTLDEEGEQGARISSASVCGVGLGAMAALQLAADHPERVDRLVLVTRQVRLSPLLLSLPAVVLALMPARAVQRLGAGSSTFLALLDQVRPVDATPLAKRVFAPTLVLCGARDPLNRRASQSLAGSLPQGRLQLLPKAGPSWPTESPHLLSQALATFLTEPG